MNIQQLVKTALDNSKPIEARRAAYAVLDATGIDSLPVDDETKLALLWAAVLDGLESPEKRQARYKAEEVQRPAPTQPGPPVPAQQAAPTELPEFPLQGFGDYFRRDQFIG